MLRRIFTPGRGDQIGSTEVVELLSAPAPLAAGHPARRLPCLICRRAIGAAEVRIVTIIDMRRHLGSCGAIPVSGFLVHAGHVTEGTADYHALAALRHPHRCRQLAS